MTDIVKRLRSPEVFVSDGQMSSPAARAGADEIERLRATLEKIATMKPPISVDGEGHAPNWDQYVFTRTWAAFAAELQRIAHTALREDNCD